MQADCVDMDVILDACRMQAGLWTLVLRCVDRMQASWLDQLCGCRDRHLGEKQQC